MSDVIAVKESDLATTIANLQSNYDNISKSFSDASDIVSQICACVEGEVSDTIRSKFSEFDLQFPIARENLQSFIDDIKNVNIAFDNAQSSVSTNEVEVDKGGEFINVNNKV